MKIKWMMMTAAMAATAAASAAILTSDDFSGTTLKAQWTAAPAGANSPVIVADGSVSTTVQYPDGNNITTSVLSTTGYVLPAGDFAVQIDESKTWSGGWYQNCFFQVGIGSNTYLLGKCWMDGSTAMVYTNGFPALVSQY